MNRSPGKKTASAAAAAAVVSPAKTEPESDSEFDADDASAVSSAASSSSSSNGDDDDDDDEDTAGTGTTTDDEEGYSVISKDTTNDNGKGRHHLGGGSSSVISSETKSHKRLLRRLQSDDPSLTSLTVDQTLLEHSSIAEIAKVLAVNTTVVQLALDLPRGFKKQHILALLNALECNDTIASLTLRNVSICRHVATSVATFFSKTPTLIKLQLKQCPFMESGLAILFLGMQHCGTLSSLSMNGCNLGGYAADIVAATVPLLELSSLQLQQTSLSLPGFEFLLQNMERTGQKMQYLDLSSNDIVGTPEGMQLLVDALESIKLQRLVLQDCGLNRSTIKTLCLEGLLTQQANSKLTHLDVSHNRDLDDRAARYLVKLLETNTKLVELHIEGCSKISKEFRLDLSDKLRYNNSFLKAIGFSSDVSLAILDSMKLLGNMTK
jgi:Leucine Rich repeat